MRVNRDELKKALQDCSRVTPTRSTEVMLSYVRIFHESNRMVIEGSDSMHFIRRIIPCTEPFESFFTPLSVLQGCVSGTNSEFIEIVKNGNKATLIDDGTKYKIEVVDKAITRSPASVHYLGTTNGERLASGIDHVSYMSVDIEARWNFSCMRLVLGEKSSVACADRSRSGYFEIGFNGKLPKDHEFLIGEKSLKCLRPLLIDEEVRIDCSDTAIQFSGDGWMISAPTMSGRFPPVDKMNQVPSKNLCVVSEEQLRPIARKLSAMLSHAQKDLGSSVILEFKEDSLVFHTAQAGVGEVTSVIPVACRFPYRSKYKLENIRDIASHCKGPTTFSLTENDSLRIMSDLGFICNISPMTETQQ